MARLDTFGCSFTSWKWPTWADILGQEFDYYENWGQHGAGNQFIFNSLVEWSIKNKTTSENTVAIMWSSITREDRYVNGQWVLPGNIYNQVLYDRSFVKKWADPRGYIIRDMAYIHAARILLEHLGVKYIFLSMIDITNVEQTMPTEIKNCNDVLDAYKETIDLIRPSVHKTIFNYDWASRPFNPKTIDQTKQEYYGLAGADWPSFEKFMAQDFTGILENIVTEIKTQYAQISPIKFEVDTKRPDAHPTPIEHLEYLDCVIPEYPISQDTRNWVAGIQHRVEHGETLNWNKSKPVSRF